MKIAFVQRGYELLGIEYLSAVLKRAGHQVRLFLEPRLFADVPLPGPRDGDLGGQQEVDLGGLRRGRKVSGSVCRHGASGRHLTRRAGPSASPWSLGMRA